jgi:hypothetical protein
MLLPAVLAFLLVGAAVAYYGYYVSIYPIQQANGFLARAQSSQTPQQLGEYVRLAQLAIPDEGNPVWLFPTVRTDFAIMQAQMEGIMARAGAISLSEPHNEEYNTALVDMHAASLALQENLDEAIPYIYVSPTNIAMGAAWVGVIMGVFAAMRRAKTRQERAATTPALQS